MLSKSSYVRPQASDLIERLRGPRLLIQVIAGPRQVGKTTLANQVASEIAIPFRFVSADEPVIRGREWLEQQWEAARLIAADPENGEALLIVDEIQKVPNWSEAVKRLWDEDSRSGLPLKVVLLGSAPLLIQEGLTESLAGRFEVVRLSHWSYSEMNAAFGMSCDEYIYFGAYPGAASLIEQPQRWAAYVRDSLIETTISKDVLLMTRVHKPALLRRLFELGCSYSGQILSYNKMLGQLQEAGNTTTLAHYLDLLESAGMIVGLQKFAGQTVRQRGSSPKLQVLNTALVTAQSGLSPEEAKSDAEFWGRLVESAVGAHLDNGLQGKTGELFYWRDRNDEVDFVVRRADRITAIEVKSTRRARGLSGMSAFSETFGPKRKLLVGGDGIAVEEFLSRPAEDWIA